MRAYLPLALLCLFAACSTPSTADDGSYAAANQADGASVVFDANGFHTDAKADAGKVDAKADVPKADVPKTDVPKTDVPKTDVNDVDAAESGTDAAASDAEDAAEPDATDVDGDVVVADADDAFEADVAVDTAAAEDATDALDVTFPAGPFAHLCAPCNSTAACNAGLGADNLCVSYGDDGAFCGVLCDPADATSCPDFYTCETVNDPTYGTVNQCKPTSGVCTCSVAAAIAQLSTTCKVPNAAGTCPGTRSCGVSGLGKCTAPVPVDEICNGVDDNCNGATDEGLCSGNACLAGTCDPVTNVCSPAPNGTTCDDANNCTTTDGCSFGTCVGTAASDGNESSPGVSIAKKSDCDGTSNMQSILAPGGDVDWYAFNASDDTFCSIYPSVRVDQMAGDYDLCVYWACKNGKSDSGIVDCNQGSKVSNGPNGAWGCCSANAGMGAEKIEINTTCSTLGAGDDGGTAWIQVSAHSPKTANICGTYRLTWSAASF